LFKPSGSWAKGTYAEGSAKPNKRGYFAIEEKRT